MDWTQYRDKNGITIEHPAGWEVERRADGTMTIVAPTRQSFVLIQPLSGPLNEAPADILRGGRFPAAGLFVRGKPSRIEAGPDGAMCYLDYRGADGPARARLACVPHGDGAMIYAYAAPASGFQQMEPVLARIWSSRRKDETPLPVTPPPLNAPEPEPVLTAGVGFVRYRFAGGEIDVPAGWQVVGDVQRTGDADVRPWVRAESGARELQFGDPEFPHWLVYYPMASERLEVSDSEGRKWMNLAPSAERLLEFYCGCAAKFAREKREERDRPDLAAALAGQLRERGLETPFGVPVSVREARLSSDSGLLAACVANAQNASGFWQRWQAMLVYWRGAEEEAARMLVSFKN